MEITNVNMNYVKEFWIWFSENCQNFGTKFNNTNLLNELDARINRLGNFSWEIGPGKTADNALVISPNGDLQLLPHTKQIIANAEKCINWEYYYAKPPKQWNLIFDLETADNKITRIDASQWDYVLLKYDDGMFEIIIKAPNISKLDDEDKLTAAEIVLDGILGEELRITKICSTEVVKEFEEGYSGKASKIKNLLDHFNSIP